MPWLQSKISRMQHQGLNNVASEVGGKNMSMIAAAGISALTSVALTLYSNWKNEQLVNKTNKIQQSNFENAYQIQSKDMQKAGFNPAMLASGSAALASAPAVQTAQNENVASSLAPLLQAFTQAYLAPAQKENIEADTKNKEGQFQHEIDMQTAEFKQQIALLDKTDEYLRGRMELQNALDMSRDEANEKLQEALNDYQTKNQEQLIKLQVKADVWLEKNKSKYRKEEDLRKALYEYVQHDADYQHQVSLLAQEVEGKMTQQKTVNDNTTRNTIIRGSFTTAGIILGGIIGGPIGAALGGSIGAAAPNVIGFDTTSVR